MPVRLRDLLAESGLALRARTGELGLDSPVSWVAPTELADPAPWLDGGELVLTTGLRLRATAAQEAFVTRLAERGASGIGFGTGLSHTQVPRALLARALRLGLPVLEVSYETPFIALVRLVAERLAAERHGEQRRLVEARDQLTAAVLAGDSLERLLRTLERQIGAQAALLTPDGAELVGRRPRDIAHRYPVQVEGVELAALVAAETPRGELLPYAARLAGLELARRLSYLAGRRALLGRVLTEVLSGGLDEGAAERMLGCYEVELHRPQQVLLGRWAGPARPERAPLLGRLFWHPSRPVSMPGEPGAGRSGGVPSDGPPSVTSAVVEGALLLLVPAGDASAAADVLRQALSRDPLLGPGATVGVGGPGTGVRGLRGSYAEARASLARPSDAGGPAVGGPRLLDLLLDQADPAIRQFGERMLQPLAGFDAQHRADLIGTLQRYLETDGSVQATAEQLFVHRNTVRYRLAQIEELTGRSLASTADRAELWLALQVRERAAEPTRTGVRSR
ncbi:purine catabolism regulator [Streptacidiphilus sp. MAP12-20]|uniref:PucR family transcriptional regulator n=1 Tax=Streptacidiphilus sp. MAP12-20 TaxID=3156299 RepID=UPI00351707C8